MKLWNKDNISTDKEVERFTIGDDQAFDLLLAPYDVLGSIAHVTMLGKVGLLTKNESSLLIKELIKIYKTIQQSDFLIEEGIEDIHSQIEFLLTKKLGDAGKRIHTARSRNDQVLLDIKLFLRNEIEKLSKEIHLLFNLLIKQSNKYKDFLLPGYTHLQLAMPSSFGLWFGAYAESLVDDVVTLHSAYRIINKNPLGSAAGYGSSFPINRALTTQLLGFDDLNYNVVYAQMTRGKTERVTAAAFANVADTLARLSMDATLFLNQNFDFISFNAELTTGSSIMPHKKNPDVFELIRSHCNRIKALPNEIMLMTTNLPSGYHRDLQLLKEHLFPALDNLKNCLRMTQLMISNIKVKRNILEDGKYNNLFSVEKVNKLVTAGMSFRDAYKKIGKEIETGNFSPSKNINHTHEGSIGNLSNNRIKIMMQVALKEFNFEKANRATQKLLAE